MMIPKKSSVSYTVFTCFKQDLHNKEEEEKPPEITTVVVAKYPPKVKLENVHNSRVVKLG